MTTPHNPEPDDKLIAEAAAYHKQVADNQRANLASCVEYEKANPWAAYTTGHGELLKSIAFHARLADRLEALAGA